MSHFSKIKTNISNIDILVKTIKQLGLTYKFIDVNNVSYGMQLKHENLLIYQMNQNFKDDPLCTFVWSGCEYNIVVDLQLWNLGMDFQYFVDRLSQQYAYNMIVSHSFLNGFQKVQEHVQDDGSIKLVLRRWNNG
uniref:Uncharacterized protein ycf35 n=1 Tax=Polysiphonia urceolata TaxID=173545 RepID=A0A1Z1MBV1_POLUR|nr:hypothetical protein [Polysiphonia stricta]ARW63450.1 hypothetical protein [Polysiphonia stricta]